MANWQLIFDFFAPVADLTLALLNFNPFKIFALYTGPHSLNLPRL
jgi:hypothetical protein